MRISSNGFAIRGLVLAALVFLGIAAAMPALAIPPSEQKTLEDLFNSTGGKQWSDNTNWLVGDPCNWFGITCADIDNDSHVIAIQLAGNNLISDLGANPMCPNPDWGNNPPVCSLPDLGALRYLRVFVVASNRLSGSLPDISKLLGLNYFDVAANQLSGVFPDISKLTNLWFFYADFNQLSGSLPDISKLTNLSIFYVADNQLSGSLPDISKLSSLGMFIATGNQFSGALPNISGLSSLTDFEVSRNQLSGKFPDMAELPALFRFDVSHNSLTGSLPDNLDKLSSLRIFSVAENQLNGPLPAPPSALIKSHGAYICPNHFDIVTDGSQFWQNLAWTIATGGDQRNPPQPWWNARSGDGQRWAACTPN